MSVSPLQNFSNPPPVPEMPTATFTPLPLCTLFVAVSKYFAATVESGATVLEPSMRTVASWALERVHWPTVDAVQRNFASLSFVDAWSDVPGTISQRM